MQNMQNKENTYFCCKCNYRCKRKFLFEQHLATKKHLKKINKENYQIDSKFSCICGKKYKHNSSYSRHVKQCIIYLKEKHKIENLEMNEGGHSQNSMTKYEESMNIKNMLTDILRENKELKSELKNLKITNTNNININVFLNETCKDAMNLTEFIDNIKLSVKDLEYSGKYGYVKGVSNILMKNLTDIEPSQRPLHCSDAKRLSFYVKDDDAWGRDKNNKKIDKSIDDITAKQQKTLKEWIKNNPNYENSKEKLEEYFNIVASLVGGGDKEKENLNKTRIIKNVSNETSIKEIIPT